MTRRRIAVGLVITVGVVVLALVAATVLTFWSIQRPYPNYDGKDDIPRLAGDVEIVRDEYGIPQIYADTAEDLFRAQGYVHAQDRFWQMDVRRHITAGRLSELFGEDQVETDAFVRTLGWRRVAEKEFPSLDPDTRRYLEAYADGVNGWLDGRSGGELGVAYTVLGLSAGGDDPEEWTPIDSLSWLKAMAWDLRGNMQDEIDRALMASELPADRVSQLYPSAYGVSAPIVSDGDLDRGIRQQSAVVPQFEPAGDRDQDQTHALRDAHDALNAAPDLLGGGAGVGSNSWVVDGAHTDTGRPILANDPHLGPSMPSIWYQAGLHCREISADCPFEVGGYTFAGVPGVIIGHNDDIAWGFTNLGADVTDLFLEQVRRSSYLVGDKWREVKARAEVIEVAGGEDVTITVRSTRHGPLISDHDDQLADVGDSEDGNYAVALRWTALEPGRTADALFAINQATNWKTFRRAAALFEVPSQNLVYADTRGNIGYQAPGKIPIRKAGDGREPVPGWTNEYGWSGYIPFDDLPSVLNPDSGIVVTANQPVTSKSHEPTLTKDYQPGYRARRIGERLAEMTASGGQVGVGDMADLEMDSHNAAAEIVVPYLLELPTPRGYYGDGFRLLANWNYSQPPDSAAAAYFNAVWSNLLRLTFHDELPEDQWPDGGGRWFTVMDELLDRPDDKFWDDVTTHGHTERRDEILRRAARDARNEMTMRQGKDPANWSWGRLHALTLEEQTYGSSDVAPLEWLFNEGPVDVGGGPDVVQATGWDASEGYETNWVPSMRMIVDLSDLDQSRWIDLTGISGHPRHEHFGDQTSLWQTGETLPMRWDDMSVHDAGEHIFTLVPSEPVD